MTNHPTATVAGFPRIGTDLSLKRTIEAYWRGEAAPSDVRNVAIATRRANWAQLVAAGLDELPCGDFSLYDHVLDTALLVGAVPSRFASHVPVGHASGPESDEALRLLSVMARGDASTPPLELTKWFGTNYHYLVPELAPDTVFTADPAKPVAEFVEATSLGVKARPVLLGPVTFLTLSKVTGRVVGFEPLALIDRLVEAYADVLAALQDAGVERVQLDEPALALDRSPAVLGALNRAYRVLGAPSSRPRILLTVPYGPPPAVTLRALRDLPVDGLGLDLTRPEMIHELAAVGGLPGKELLAGVVDGGNVWANDLRNSLATLGVALGLAETVTVSTSCSLMHVPVDVGVERRLDPLLRRCLAFADQKAREVAVLARGIHSGAETIRTHLAASDAVQAIRRDGLLRDDAVRARAAAVGPDQLRRQQTREARAAAQSKRLGLPLFPTTTIGSFPQTPHLRRARADLVAGRIDESAYVRQMSDMIGEVVRLQERVGLDVLVHGEPERNDMVQYFAEQLVGFATTQHGWVQSYGSRYVRPPILAGDVSRPGPMTVDWIRRAQALTDRPVKGMLTGPVTMLAWSFVRDDQPLEDTARQVALALRDEVADLEAAGTTVIQVDEPGLRESLPLRADDQADYLRWAVEAFRLATSGVRDDTQIHTHMCYAEFGDVMGAIVGLDADVISLEAARSGMAVAAELAAVHYPGAVGPGVYDIHSPRVPDTDEMIHLLSEAVQHVPVGQLWVNPDCGLKTRTLDEVEPALTHLVRAARQLRMHYALSAITP